MQVRACVSMCGVCVCVWWGVHVTKGLVHCKETYGLTKYSRIVFVDST